MKHNTFSFILILLTICFMYFSSSIFKIRNFKNNERQSLTAGFYPSEQTPLNREFNLTADLVSELAPQLEPTANLVSFKNLENQYSDLSNEEINNKLKLLNQSMQKNNHKKFIDFKPIELMEYQNLNRQKVVLTKLLIKRKFENLGYGQL